MGGIEMEKRKWKKLSKRFACALALAMLMSVNPAWAAVEESEDGTALTITNQTYNNHTLNNTSIDISKYDTVTIDNNNLRGIQIWGGLVCDWSRVNLDITTEGGLLSPRNLDALHVHTTGADITVGNFKATVSASASDALNISHDSSSGKVHVLGDLTSTVSNGNGVRANAPLKEGGENVLTIDGTTNLTIKAGIYGLLRPTAAVYAGSDVGEDINKQAQGHGIINLKNVDIKSSGTFYKGFYGIWAGRNGTINLNDNIEIESDSPNSFGIAATNGNISNYQDMSPNKYNSTVTMKGTENYITLTGNNSKALYASSTYGKILSGDGFGLLEATGDISAEDSGTIDLKLKKYLTVNGTVSAASNGTVTLASAGQNSVVSNGAEYNGSTFGAGDALTADAEGSSVLLSSEAGNYVGGGVSATGKGSVSITGAAGAEGSLTDGVDNSVLSSVTQTATVTQDDGTTKNVSFTNAVYAKNGGTVEITAGDGGVNTIATYTPEAAPESKERAIWASEGGVVTINGVTNVTAGLTTFAASDNSARIAIAAGTDDWQTNAVINDETGEIIFDVADENRSHVYLNYGDTAGTASSVTGDIVSGYGGSVSVAKAAGASDSSNMKFTGNALAANGGTLTLELGDGGSWAGRADDYQDAANQEWKWADKHTEIFAPQFSNGIQSNGSVNVDLGSGSVWNVTGQSWVSKLDGDGHVYLNGEDTGGYALHIGELTGSNTFYLNLYNGDKIGDGDMIYIAKEVSAPQKIEIVNRDTVLSSMKAGDRIRFATIGGEVGFSAGAASTQPVAAFGKSTRIKDAGMLNVDFSIDYLDYNHADNDDENHEAYHGGQEMQEDKPGVEYVDSIYGANENSQNVYITRLESTENPTEEPKLSDAGRTVLNMSRANYAAAVYMDRLNKRMGEARYFAGQDEGIWARIRHDRVGRDDAFLVQNTMFEVGYDRKIASKTGTRRVGIAADYMEGDTEYNDIAGEGEIDRFGLWLYSTWLGEKGHYTDYVLKWGRMSNEFDIYGMSTGERITGDYDNNVFSASAEYGRKIELGKGWFFEPQAQVQFARITDADYVTSQGTRVEVDGVNSLIARAGFRLGREFGGKNQGSVYVKADVLHEFLGDQDVHALDGTTDSRWYTVGYDNDGTWYDVGLGLSCRTGKNSFVFLDLEHSFGNDNDDSYQISAGVQWSF